MGVWGGATGQKTVFSGFVGKFCHLLANLLVFLGFAPSPEK